MLDFNNKMSYEDFVSLPTNVDDVSESICLSWYERNFLSQMMDIWGEADKTMAAYNKWKNDKNDQNYEAIKSHINVLDKYCRVIYSDRSKSEGKKYELKVAEWELLDFIFWDNLFENDEKSVMKWFNQFCYDINYDLL